MLTYKYKINNTNMNYKALKWMMENLTTTYKCPECNSEVDEWFVDIIWAAWNTINIDIECHECHKHSMIKSEVISLDLSQVQNIEWLQNSLKWLIWNKQQVVQNKDLIKDEHIVELNKDLKKWEIWVSELFKEEK